MQSSRKALGLLAIGAGLCAVFLSASDPARRPVRASAGPPVRRSASLPVLPPPPCAPDNGGWTLPEGFCALTVAESLGPVRHLAVAPNGDVFAARNQSRTAPGGVIVLRDANHGGRADSVHQFFVGAGGSGLLLTADAVYFATNDSVLRFPWKPGELKPAGPMETIARGLPS